MGSRTGMGTELHYSPTTLLEPNHDHVATIFDSQDSLVGCNNRLLKVGIRIGFNWLLESMDRLLDQYSRESIRNTMSKHEEIFKQQVQELHRLYGVQQMLIAGLRGKEVYFNSHTPATTADTRTRVWSSSSTSETSHSLHDSNRDHYFAQLNRCSTTADASSRELSSCSEDRSRTRKGFDLESHAINDRTTVLRKHSETDGESEVELTLNIGCGSDQKKPKRWLDPNNGLGRSNPSPSERLQRPSWIFEALSLNRI